MKTTAFTAALALAILTAAPAFATDATITIAHPWLRATPRSAPVAGGYVALTNTGKESDTLVSASLPMASEGQVHNMTMKNGIMEMRRLDDGLVIAPGATVTLQPGGDHLMFIKPTAQLKEGESIAGSLTFKHAGTLPVTFAVGGMAAKSAPGTKAGSTHQGMGMHGMDMKGTDMKGMKMKGMDMH